MSGDGMAEFVAQLTTGLSADAVWSAIAPVAPFIIVAVLVGISRRLINKNLSSIHKGKAGKAN